MAELRTETSKDFQKKYIFFDLDGTLIDPALGFRNAWEFALKKYNISLMPGESSYSNIIRISSDKYDHGLHETQKPLNLMKCLISLVTVKGAIVLDPFAGSGTTCVAAKRLDRHYIGIEIDEKYVHIAQKRLFDELYENSLLS